MAEESTWKLASGNVVSVDGAGIRILSPSGQELSAWPGADLTGLRRSGGAVVLAVKGGQQFELLTDEASAVGLEAEIRARMKGAPMSQVDFDNKGQMERIQGGLVPGETLYAVYDMKGGGSGFVGITDRRLIIQDEGRLKKRRQLISIPYSRITMVGAADEGGIIRSTSELTVYAGSQEFELEFRSGDKAQRAYTFIIQHLK